ncbi:MAG: NifU N-terminal domain-containing protein, partial [Ilumatobacter sp.]|nr:NifU N-terminal domain-containing protein [Ilumatobacter sp.]
MGQQIAVVAKPSPNAGVLRFEANRNLTGMGHELFRSAAEAIGPRPAAKLARTLLEAGGVDTVHIYGNMITVDLAKGANGSGVADAIRDLYQYWKPGMELPVFEDVVAEAAPAAAAGDAGE